MDAKQFTNVETLLNKAASAAHAAEAINYAQAACNAANALRVLTEVGALYGISKKKEPPNG